MVRRAVLATGAPIAAAEFRLNRIRRMEREPCLTGRPLRSSVWVRWGFPSLAA